MSKKASPEPAAESAAEPVLQPAVITVYGRFLGTCTNFQDWNQIARFRLYQRRFLQEATDFSTCFEIIYKIHFGKLGYEAFATI